MSISIRNQPIFIEEISLSSSPFQLFLNISSEPYSFILDSNELQVSKPGFVNFSFMGFAPFMIIKSYMNNVQINNGNDSHQEKSNPLDVLENLLRTHQVNSSETPFPFTGGAVGFFGYPIRHFIEKLPEKNKDDLLMPHLYFGFYDCIIAIDHLQNRGYIISNGLPEKDEQKRIKRARERLREVKSKLEEPGKYYMHPSQTACSPDIINIKSNFTRDEYFKAVHNVKDYILAGDIFQANLSQRFETNMPFPPVSLYGRLRKVNPSPFSAYLSYPEGTIACSSPERFLKVTGEMVETRPIKGTRPRGSTPLEDYQLSRALVTSAKDKAENMMIVDLERNDLGRVCRYGTIKVNELASLETFPTVFHLTSTISGKLEVGKSVIDLIKATFPGGSITGAPKVRAMEIIDELEPNQRGPYTGSLGYISANGNADLNIIIRTFILKDGKAYFNVGGGIVHDSQPELEYQETLDKAKGLLQALKLESVCANDINNR